MDFFVLFYSFVITPPIIQIANYKNVFFYHISNLIIRAFFLYKKITKWSGKFPLFLGLVSHMPNTSSSSIFSPNKSPSSSYLYPQWRILLYHRLLRISISWLSKSYLYLHLSSTKTPIHSHQHISEFIINIKTSFFVPKHIYTNTSSSLLRSF